MTDSLLPSMSLESRRCEQSIHDSRRLSKEFNEVVALLTDYRALAESTRRRHAISNDSDCEPCRRRVARIDKCLAALKGQKGA